MRTAAKGRRAMPEEWLKCEVLPGLFSNEAIVVVRDLAGHAHRYFVPLDAVSTDRVRVRVSNGGDLLWATIPTAQPSSVVAVKQEDLVAA
ncbi:MAG: hypothetical protein ACHQ1G_00720 [Planctomycetota bacterium]